MFRAFRNQRGEAVTVALLGVALVSVFLGFFARPVFGKIMPGVFGSDQKIVTTKTVESKPVWMKNPDGSSTLVQTTNETYQKGNEPVPLTMFQKIAQLGWMTIIVLVLCVLTPVGGIIMVVWQKVMAGVNALKMGLETSLVAREQLSEDAKLIVKGVDEGLSTMDNSIASAQATITNTQAMPDSPAKTQQLLIAQALLICMTSAKKDFLAAMSRKQNNTTKLLVAELKND